MRIFCTQTREGRFVRIGQSVKTDNFCDPVAATCNNPSNQLIFNCMQGIIDLFRDRGNRLRRMKILFGLCGVFSNTAPLCERRCILLLNFVGKGATVYDFPVPQALTRTFEG